MSRIARTLPDPKDPLSMVEYLSRVQRIVDGDIDFGSPQDPKDPQSTTLANGTSHNGTLVNMHGAWVEMAVEALNSNLTCTHNLNIQVLSASQPNVRWLIFGWQHDNDGAGAGSTMGVLYVDGTVGADSIGLRFVATGRTVDASHPLRVSLFFTPAVRGIAQ